MNMENNPFKAPEARVADAAVGEGEFIPEGQRVPAGNAVTWLSEGWSLFRQAPGVWIGLTVIFIVLVVILSVIPLVNLVVNLLMPVFIGGIMIGAKALDKGGDLEIGHLFAGFSGHAGNLILVGLINLAAVAGVMVVMMILGGFGAVMAGNTQGISPAAFLLPMLIVALLMVPLAMAMWYAPALVVFHGVGPFDALKASFFVCLKNFVPFLVYGLLILVLAVVASIPIFLGWLVLAPVLYASMYTSYKDMFLRA